LKNITLVTVNLGIVFNDFFIKKEIHRVQKITS